MLYKSTLKLLLVSLNNKSLLLPVVSNSYKKTLWLLLHREPEALAIGILEGSYDNLKDLNIGEVDINTIHSIILKLTNVTYTSIGKQPQLSDRFTLDYSLPIKEFIIKYTKLFTPDEFLIILGIRHSKLFKLIANLTLANDIKYSPENGVGKWSYYDYYWLHERYRHKTLLDIKPILNRSSSQIKFRAFSIGLTRKTSKLIVSNINLEMSNPITETCLCGKVAISNNQCKACLLVELSPVDRDYKITQIADIVSTILNKGK